MVNLNVTLFEMSTLSASLRVFERSIADGSSNPPVMTSTLSCIATLHDKIGDAIRQYGNELIAKTTPISATPRQRANESCGICGVSFKKEKCTTGIMHQGQGNEKVGLCKGCGEKVFDHVLYLKTLPTLHDPDVD